MVTGVKGLVVEPGSGADRKILARHKIKMIHKIIVRHKTIAIHETMVRHKTIARHKYKHKKYHP
jgi:hypothetical protein